VDFGAVRDTFVDGSTMIGTFGYMPPEQACTTQCAMPLARN
jgi:hypothetical protein